VNEDVIGVHLEYTGENATLSFSKNSVPMGVAYENLTGTFFPAVSLYYEEAQVSILNKF
jgi:hypothetical protein